MLAGAKLSSFSKPAWSALAILLVGVLGWLDHITGPELSFSIFYLLPVSLAAWRGGFWSGLITSLVSAVVWFIADAVGGPGSTRSIVPYWNTLVRFEFFVLAVMLICNTKRLNQSLEEQARQLRQEVVERRQAQEALAESQKIFRLITENVSDLISVLNLDRKRLYSSPSYQTMLDEPEALRGRDYLAEVLPDDREQVQAAFGAALQSGRNQRTEYRMTVPFRPLRYMESEWSVIREKDGAVRNVVVVSRDVTARKRMELLYANEKDILETIAQGKPLPEVLNLLIRKVELWSEGLVCSILVRDAEHNAVLHEGSHVAATVFPAPAPGQAESPAESAWLHHHQSALGNSLQLVYDKPIVSTLGEVLGGLRIYARESPNAESIRLQVFDKIAHVAAIALERQRSEETLRRLSSLILNAQEAERRRLARELHDSVSQMLASVAFRVESILTHIPPENQAGRQEVTKTRFLLKKAIHEVRSISENLRPSELDELGLIAAVRDLCEDFKERSQLDVQLSLPAVDERFANDIELTLYRIVQESLTNVEKHAEASQVVLALHSDPASVTLTIRDNGKGLPPATNGAANKRQGMGLIGMRERCAFLGGTFSVQSRPQMGTEIAARVPRSRMRANNATILDSNGRNRENQSPAG